MILHPQDRGIWSQTVLPLPVLEYARAEVETTTSSDLHAATPTSPVVTVTVPLAAIVVPPVLFVACIIAFVVWRVWKVAKRRKLAAQSKAEEQEKERLAPRPFLTAEPISPILVVDNSIAAPSPLSPDRSASTPVVSISPDEKHAATLAALGKTGSREPNPIPPPLTLHARNPSNSSTIDMSNLSAAQEKFMRWSEARAAASRNPTTNPASSPPPTSPSLTASSAARTLPVPPTAAASTIGATDASSGIYVTVPPEDVEDDEAFQRYSQELARAMQRVGFTPQALLESLNRVRPASGGGLTIDSTADVGARRRISHESFRSRHGVEEIEHDDAEARPPAYDD